MNLENLFFGLVQSRELDELETGDLVRYLKLTEVQERALLSRLARRGMIARLRRGKYLVPRHFPISGSWSPSEATAVTQLIADREGLYQICGPNAFHRYGWDEQVPNRLYAYNNRISGNRTVGSVSMTLIRVSDDRLGATEAIVTPEGVELIYASRIRSLMDAIYDWSRFDTVPRGYDWIRAELKRDRATAATLIDATLRYGNQGTIRRIGRLLEAERVNEPLLKKLERALNDSSSLIPWIPSQPKHGPIDRRWGVVVNES